MVSPRPTPTRRSSSAARVRVTASRRVRPVAELRAAGAATTRIRLATDCTNTVTEHPSAVATAIAAIQIAYGGRAIRGVGKGNSSMGMIGREPRRHAEFVEKTTALRAHLRGESIELGGYDSRLEWLDEFPQYEPVPLEIMCSGPKTMTAAAALADRITFSVGAAEERLRCALRRRRRRPRGGQPNARRRTGRRPRCDLRRPRSRARRVSRAPW
jgi:5,10-methylenetetrahydromethanopterin reductase